MMFADDKRLQLTHYEIMIQNKMIEEARKVVRKGDEHFTRFIELKVATECRGLSFPIKVYSIQTQRHSWNTR